MCKKVYLVLDVFDLGFKIFDNVDKAWNCFVEWVKDYYDDPFDYHETDEYDETDEEDEDSFNELEALKTFLKNDYYYIYYGPDCDRPFLITQIIVE